MTRSHDDTESSGGGGRGLIARSITATLWGAGGSVIRIVLQIVAQIVLARLLGPELYGVFAVALVAVLLSSLFADVGLAYGLIQKSTVDDDDIRFVFTWQVLLGIVTSAAVAVAAPWVASLYSEPRLGPAIAGLAITCLVNSAGATAGALLRRELDFKTLNIAAVVSYAVGFFGVGIPMALMGFGVMSLVAAYAVQTTLAAVIQYARVRHAVRPLFWQPGAPAMLDFGLTVLATNLVNWAMNGIDRAIVGSWLGLSAAGLYATAYNLISTPLVTLLALLQSVFYSASAKVQDDPGQMRRGLLALFGAIALFVAPVFAGIAASAETLMQTLYGVKWSGGGMVLAPLALAMPAYLAMGIAIPLLWASGATRKELQLQAPIAVVWVGGLWSVAQVGSLALLGWAVLALFLARATVLVAATLKAIRLDWREALAAVRAGFAVTALVGIAALVADYFGSGALGYGARALVLDVAVSAIAFVLGLRLFGALVGRDLADLLGQLADRMPGGYGRRSLALLLRL